jgi:EAL domain-containing protein (putative c-di-GMP-specific phosphodiesterase class I)/DNA-binding response OmpR family regulator
MTDQQHQPQQQRIDSVGQVPDAAEPVSHAKLEDLANWGDKLRAPLHTLLAQINILQMDRALDANTRQQIDKIAKGAKRLATLISELPEHIDSNCSTSSESSIVTTTVTSDKTGRRCILVAEDRPANQMLLQMQLAALGFDADIAADNTAALFKWQEGGHDLVLIGHQIPDLDKVKLARAIRTAKRASGAYTPIIAITTEPYPKGPTICREAGIDAVLAEPVELDALRCLLEYWLDKSAAKPVIATLDTSNLVNLIGTSDVQQMREFVGLFITTVHTDIASCRQHFTEGTAHALALVMHKIKSSARIVGALHFASLAERIEAAAKNSRLDTAQMLFIELEDALEKVEIAAKKLTVSEAYGLGDAALMPDKIGTSMKVTESPIVATVSPNHYLGSSTSVRPTTLSISSNDILAGIRHAEFQLYFQPKVDSRTLHVVGVETLARWQRQGESPPPDEFFAIAKKYGLVAPLSEVLLTKALISGIQFTEAGCPLALSVNLSANWLADTRFPQFILASIQAFNFKAENLILEITDLDMMSDMTAILKVMNHLRLEGFKLSVTDFGSGYPLAALLPHLPVNELKFDRRFVRAASQNPAVHATMAATLAIAKRLKLATVAAGVETQADLDRVRDLGCGFVQGWFIAKEMPEDQLLEWLKGHVA